MSKKLLNTKQVADMLGVNILAVYSYIKSGKLKAHKLGGNGESKRHWRIWYYDLEIFVGGQSSGAGSEHGKEKVK